MLHVQNEDF